MECRSCQIREIKELGRNYKSVKKRNEEMRQNIRKMKNVCEQYLPNMRNRISFLEATVNQLQKVHISGIRIEMGIIDVDQIYAPCKEKWRLFMNVMKIV